MKSKIFTLSLLIAFFSQLSMAQPTEWWTSEPGGQGNDIKFIKEASSKTEGNSSAKIELYSTGTPYVYSAEFDVTAGSAYSFSIDVLDNTEYAYFKIYCEFYDADKNDIYGESPVTTDDNADWKTISWSSTVPENAVKAYVWVKLYDKTGFTAPQILYLDNAIFSMDGGANLVPNGGFEEWLTAPTFQSFSFMDFDPAVNGTIDNTNFTVDLAIPYTGDITNLIPTFTVEEGTTVELEANGEHSPVVSGTTAIDFTNNRTFKLTKNSLEQNWTIKVSKEAASAEKKILSFDFKDLDPEVKGRINENEHTISLEVPTGTILTTLVPTISISDFASISPESGAVKDFSEDVTYTVMAQDESKQDYTVTVVAKEPTLPAQPTEWWTDEPGGQGNDLVFNKETVLKTEGTFAAKIDLYSTGTPYLYSAQFDVTSGSAYTFSIDILDTTAFAHFKIYCEFYDANEAKINGEPPVVSEDKDDWQTITWSANVPTDATKGYVWVKFYDDTDFTSPQSLFLDNAIFKMDGGENLVPNGGFEEWNSSPKFKTFNFENLEPVVEGSINSDDYNVNATVPFSTDLTALVPTFTVAEGIKVELKAGDEFTEVVSGTTAIDFTETRTFKLTKSGVEQLWTVSVLKDAPNDEKKILSFTFQALDPVVYGEIDEAAHKIKLDVPKATNVTALVPTISISQDASVTPKTDIAQDFTNPVEYTVTAQDGSSQKYTVTVNQTDEVVLFQEYFEGTPRVIPEGFVLIENDHYTPNTGDERWKDSAWVVATSSRPECEGNHMAIALSYYSDMPEDGRTDDWMILPAITIGSNSTLSWKAMSLTSSGNFPDDYRVIVAPASKDAAPSVSYFETYGRILLTVAPESWSAAVKNPGEGISSRSINLKDEGYENQDVWIAFVLITGEGGGSYLAIDDIKVVEGATSTEINDIDAKTFDTNIYPNPANERFFVSFNSDRKTEAGIEIYDLTGKKVSTRRAEVNKGPNQIEINTNKLNTGVYLIKTNFNGKSNVTKLLVE